MAPLPKVKDEDVKVLRRLTKLFYYDKAEAVKLFPKRTLPSLYKSSTSYWLIWPEGTHTPVGQHNRMGQSESTIIEIVRNYMDLVQRLYPDAIGSAGERVPRGWRWIKV